MKFTKMHGAGNDYVYIDLFEEKIEDPSQLAIAVSDRHFGIGSDGLILIAPSDKAGGRMIMYNSDGSEGAMCGNGVRCVAKFLFDNGRISRTADIETKSGIVGIEVVEIGDYGKAAKIKVDMGMPGLKPVEIPTTIRMKESTNNPIISYPLQVNEKIWSITCVSMGNPHTVIFCDNIDSLVLPLIGPLIEKNKIFPDRTNVEFVEIISRKKLRQRTWERGAGETLACGSGACAAAVAGVLNDLSDRSVEIELRGGKLEIEWKENNHVYMTGPAVKVFEGEFIPSELIKNICS